MPSSHTGFASNFKIGAALNKRFRILFHSTSIFFNTENEGTVAEGMAGRDLQIHFGRKGRSFYVFGGAGYHNVMHFSLDDPYSGGNSFGFGVRGGAGFEIVKYLTIEGHVQHGLNEAEHNPTSFAVAINFLKRRRLSGRGGPEAGLPSATRTPRRGTVRDALAARACRGVLRVVSLRACCLPLGLRRYDARARREGLHGRISSMRYVDGSAARATVIAAGVSAPACIPSASLALNGTEASFDRYRIS